MNWRRILLGAAVAVSLAWYYGNNALDHARVLNTEKVHGDQRDYLFEAQILYRNWHGLNDPPVVQPRSRMPLYPAFLASFYEPSWTDWEFFAAAKTANVYLSLALLVVLGVVFFRMMPALPAANLLGVIAFGYYAFKAGYTQSELLFYTLHLLTVIACWRMFGEQRSSRRLCYSVAAGVVGALAYLTKAATLPFVILVVLVAAGRALFAFVRTREPVSAALLLAPPIAFVTVFLLVLYPYTMTSKRIHGQYFYNMNTSVLVWYDSFAEGVEAIASSPNGWPPGRASTRPGPGKYWREHSIAQIAGRFGRGFRDMWLVSFQGYMYGKSLALYLVAALVVAATRGPIVWALLRRHAALAMWLAAYAAVYLPVTAFYEPISGSGTARFLLAHLGPLLFALTMFLTHPAVTAERWHTGGFILTVRHFHALVAVILVSDLLFVFRHRLMTTSGAF